MAIIFENDNFVVEAHDRPHHDRNNGGHCKVYPKTKYVDRTEMPEDLYIEMMKLVRITGKAVTTVMRGKGIEVVRINYQDNGNWSFFPTMSNDPKVHIHLYTRSKNEKHPAGDERYQAFPQALYFPFVGDEPEYYESFKPYTKEDCEEIRNEIGRLVVEGIK